MGDYTDHRRQAEPFTDRFYKSDRFMCPRVCNMLAEAERSRQCFNTTEQSGIHDKWIHTLCLIQGLAVAQGEQVSYRREGRWFDSWLPQSARS